MYYPYFRGKRHELLAIEHAVTNGFNFIPIIEPVRRTGSKAHRKNWVKGSVPLIFIVNPRVGDYSHDYPL